jgi:predicted ATPase
MRTRIDVSRVRAFSKFVGRQEEMATLEAALTRMLAGAGQVVGVVAVAGTGKSRLCTEFTAHCRARGIQVADAHCPSIGKNVPFLPLRPP